MDAPVGLRVDVDVDVEGGSERRAPGLIEVATRPKVRVTGAGIVRELRPMLRLAGPVVVAELGWMAMGIVDTLTVGPLGAGATGAVGLANNLFFAVVIFGIGLLLGLDTVVAQDHGAGREDDARASLAQGVYLALGLTPVAWGLIHLLIPVLPRLGILPEVLAATVPLLRALAWSAGPLLVFTAIRRYLQAIDVVRPITAALVSANLVNAAACLVLVYGLGGWSGLGIVGSGWATGLARVYLMVAALASFVAYGRGTRGGQTWRLPALDLRRLGRLLQLGWPAALQLGLEVGVFSTATALAGRLDTTSLAAHQIVLAVSSLTFMVPLGIASAGAVRVGQALGRGDRAGAATSGWTALAIGSGCMVVAGAILLGFGRPIIRGFTHDEAVMTIGLRLFALAAAFQLFDGVQVIATGALRGVGDTRSPMLCNLVAHWLVGLPLGSLLAFRLGFGVVGLWAGLALGLTLAGFVNLATWAYRARHLDRIDPVALGAPAHP